MRAISSHQTEVDLKRNESLRVQELRHRSHQTEVDLKLILAVKSYFLDTGSHQTEVDLKLFRSGLAGHT